MDKKIIVAALAGAFIAPAVMADVTLYGFISAAVEGVSATGTQGTNAYPGRTRVEDENSRIGFKGNEDLGNGTKAIWQVENSLKNFDQGGTSDTGAGATFATRNSFVGLSDSTWGSFVMGYNDTAYKRYTNVGANTMADTTADIMGASDGSDIASRGDTRLKNSVHYDSPNLSGFQFGASYGFDEARTSTTTRGRASLGASYTNGPLKLAAGYDRMSDTAANPKASFGGFTTQAKSGVNTTFYKLAAGYKLPTDTLLAAVFERATYGNPAGTGANLTQNDWTVAAVQTFGNASVRLSYSKLGGLNNTTVGSSGDWSANQWVLGATYNLSKQTQLLAYVTRIHNDKYQNVNFGVDPLYTSAATSVGGTYTSLSSGNTLKAIGAGIKVSF